MSTGRKVFVGFLLVYLIYLVVDVVQIGLEQRAWGVFVFLPVALSVFAGVFAFRHRRLTRLAR